MKRKQRLENETEKLQLEEELAIATAREQIYSGFESDTNDDMNAYYEQNINYKSTPVTSATAYVPDTPVTTSIPVTSSKRHVSGTPTTKFSPILRANSPSSTYRPFEPRTHEVPPVSYNATSFRQPETRRNTTHMTNQTVNEDRFRLLIDRQCDLTEMLMQQNQQSLLPRLSLPRFKGDPIEYTTFIQGFDMQFGKKLKSDSDRLRYLDQHLDGEAKELVKRFFYMQPGIGYVEARKLLRDKYGDPYRISNAFIKKATERPILKPGDSIGLEHFSTFLTNVALRWSRYHICLSSTIHTIYKLWPRNCLSICKVDGDAKQSRPEWEKL